MATLLLRNIFTSSTGCASIYSAENLLSPQNRSRFLQKVTSIPATQLNLKMVEREKKQASVLVPICVDENGKVSLLYTVRSGSINSHVRQISFPGGIRDPTDHSFELCALRETEEEIGLPKSRVEIWCSGPVIALPGTPKIVPVFGIIKNLKPDELALNYDEVGEVFQVAISKLASPDCLKHTQFRYGYSTPVFLVGNYKIWGITGYITFTFLKCLLPELIADTLRLKYVKPYKVRSSKITN